ncbi:PadR family transcriptional regulator [Pseudonocardia spinosispora]|uniref:PadR family transcriptional regulator n=1 Tax=Pseudonocardia spinosispora TaxID=103441 RepID=UPI00048B4D07|nr:PadR family transcriptional regulator [Pseudonocardia spinosispora]
MQRSGLAVGVLALLLEEPMHPYRMQRLIKERGKELVINVGQRSQLYKTIDRLRAEGLIDVADVERDAARPERTVYSVTEAGRRILIEWTVEMVATPRRDFPDFAAGLAYLAVLDKDSAVAALETRLTTVSDELAGLERETDAVSDVLPRIVLIESEYLIARLRTDRDWIQSLIDDIRNGRLNWDTNELIELARQMGH